jgi:F-type H+-transporting ATPase subunit b
MWAFRVAISWLLTGLAVFFLVIHRNEFMQTLINLLQDSEFWVAVGLVVLLLGFVKLHVPKLVAKMLDDRAGAIAKELDEAKRLREEAAALLAGYVQKSAQAENEAASILADAKTEAEHYAKEMRAQLRAQIDRRAQMARDKIEQAETAALEEIQALAADKAAAAAGKLIAQKLDAPRSDKLVQESINALTDKLN